MYGKLHSACLYGIDGVLIEVETDLSNGLPQTSIIGLPDSAIREAVERVRAAIKTVAISIRCSGLRLIWLLPICERKDLLSILPLLLVY